MTKKQLLVILKVAVSGGLIWFLLSSIDIGAAKDRVLAADPAMIALAGIVMIAQVCVAGARWYVVLRAIEAPLPLLELIRLFWIGSFFSQALPSSVGGDPIRIYMAYKGGLSLGKSINGVMLERVVTVLGLVVLATVVQPAFLPKLDDDAQMLTLGVLGMLGAAAIGGLLVLMFLDRLPDALTKFRVVRGMFALAGDTRRVFLNMGSAAMSLFLGVLTHLNISLVVFCLAVALSVDVTWVDCMVLMPIVVLVTTLPISIAGWGVREGAMVAAFALVGVPNDGALVLSLTLGVLVIIMMIPGGILWLMGRSRGEAISAAEAEAAVEEELEHIQEEEQRDT